MQADRSTRRLANAQNAIAAIRRSPLITALMNGFFCISLWLSLALALWMARGWLGLFFSGQVISVAAYLVKGLARKTWRTFSLNHAAVG